MPRKKPFQDKAHHILTQMLNDGLISSLTLLFPIPKTLYKFQFCVILDNSETRCMIEIDDQQHFQPRKNDEKQQLQRQQYNDIYKNIWCRQMQIPLLRIAYNLHPAFASIIHTFIQKAATGHFFFFEFHSHLYGIDHNLLFILPPRLPRQAPRQPKEKPDIKEVPPAKEPDLLQSVLKLWPDPPLPPTPPVNPWSWS